MTRLYFGLMSSDGDRLGHLVRGVQMLRSYGREFEIDFYSDVVETPTESVWQSPLFCVIGGESEADDVRVRGMCRETQWSLGNADGSETLRVAVVRHGLIPGADTEFAGIGFPFPYVGFGAEPGGYFTQWTGAGVPGAPAVVPFQALIEGRPEFGTQMFLQASEFEKACGWAQQGWWNESDIMGEWPGAVAEAGS